MKLEDSVALPLATPLVDDVISNSNFSLCDNTPLSFAMKVYVRVRPFIIQRSLQQHNGNKPQTTVKVGPNEGIITILDPSKNYAPRCTYGFSGCFDSNATGCDQHVIYQHVGSAILQNVVDGYNGCVFAYGQTGSGKTYTMFGPSKPKTTGCLTSGNEASSSFFLTSGGDCNKVGLSLNSSQSNVHMSTLKNIPVHGHEAELTLSLDNESDGLIPRIAQELFKSLHQKHNKTAAHTFRVEVESYEIYNEKIFDMLRERNNNTTELRLLHQPTCGAYVEGLTRKHVTNEDEILYWIRRGISERHTASTKLNYCSSRSHAIFSIHIEQIFFKESGLSTRVSSKLNLIDLAGSERTGATGAEGKHFIEGTKINLSLTTLGRVIDALADISSGKSGVFCPYRDSNLTWLLMDSLGGNSKTSMIATISPCVEHYEYTCQTLRYASRAKQIVNKAVINEDPQVLQIKELAAEVKRLQALLRKRTNSSGNNENTDKLQEQILKLELDIANRDCAIDSLRSQLAEKNITEVRQLLLENQRLRRELKNFKQTQSTVALLEKKLKTATEKNEKLSAQVAELEKLQKNTSVVGIIYDKEVKKEVNGEKGECNNNNNDNNNNDNNNNNNGGGGGGGSCTEEGNNNDMQLKLGEEILERLTKLGINIANNTVTNLIDTLTLTALDAKKNNDKIIQKNILLVKAKNNVTQKKTRQMSSKEDSAFVSVKEKSLESVQQMSARINKSREVQRVRTAVKDILTARINSNREKQVTLYEDKLREKEKELGKLSRLLTSANARLSEESAVMKTLKEENKNFQKQLESLSTELNSLINQREKHDEEAKILRDNEESLKKELLKAEELLELSKKNTELFWQNKNELIQKICTFIKDFFEDRQQILFSEAINRQDLIIRSNELLFAHEHDIMTAKINEINDNKNIVIAQAEATSSSLLKEVNSLRYVIELCNKQHIKLMTNFVLLYGFCNDVLFEIFYNKAQLVEETYGIYFTKLSQQQNVLLENFACAKREMEVKEKQMRYLLESETASHKEILRQKEEEFAQNKTFCDELMKKQQNVYCMEMNLMLSQMNKYLDVTLQNVDNILELNKSGVEMMICEVRRKYNNHIQHLTHEAENKKVEFLSIQNELGEANKKQLILESTIKKEEARIDRLKEELEQTKKDFYEKENHLKQSHKEEKTQLNELITKKNYEKNKALQELLSLKILFVETRRFTEERNSLYMQYIDALITTVSGALKEMRAVTLEKSRCAWDEELRKVQNAHLLKVDKLEKATCVAKAVINQLLADARTDCAVFQKVHREQLLLLAGCCFALFAELEAGREAVAREEAIARAELARVFCHLATLSGRCNEMYQRFIADHVAFGELCVAEHAALLRGICELSLEVNNTAQRHERRLRENCQTEECLRLESATRCELIFCEESERCLIKKFMENFLLFIKEKSAFSREILTTTRELMVYSDLVDNLDNVNVQHVLSIPHYLIEAFFFCCYKQCLLEEFVTHLTVLNELCGKYTYDSVVIEIRSEYELKIKAMEADFQQEILLLQKEEAERKTYLEKVREFSDFEANLDYLERSVLQNAQKETLQQNNQLHIVKDGANTNSFLPFNRQQNTKTTSSFFSSFF